MTIEYLEIGVGRICSDIKDALGGVQIGIMVLAC
jgi:hypothetical protein